MDEPPPRAPRLGAILLAAGRSTRMAGGNKLLRPIAGRPMIVHSAEAALAARLSPVIAVLGWESERTARALAGLSVKIVVNPAFGEGISSSVRAGLLALPSALAGVVILLADMPWVSEHHIGRLVAAFSASGGLAVCVASRNGVRGNPVLWPADLFPRLLTLSGDRGGHVLLPDLHDRLVHVVMDDDGVLRDVDTEADLEAGC